MVLGLLHGLPLALTQAGSYMRETNVSAAAYAKHYDSTWGRLMKKEGRFPLDEYGDRSVQTTWTISYEQVQRRSDGAACLLKLWGFLDSGEVWYELIAACKDLAEETDVPTWLLEMAEDELEFAEVMGLLSRYSLIDGKEGTDSYSMHSVLHRWCSSQAKDEERQALGCLAVELVESSVPSKSETEFWRKRKRIMAHGAYVSRWIVKEDKLGERQGMKTFIQPGSFYNLGYLLDDEHRQQAEQMYQRALAGYEKAWGPDHTKTLDTVNNLGVLYADLGKLEQAEHMYQRALAGKEKAWGPDHTSTLDTVNNLGVLYKALGKLEQAEHMYQRALAGYEKAWGPDHTKTLDTVNNLGVLYADLGKLEQAEHMYQRALAGYKKAWGPDHTETLDTINNLGLLYADLGKLEQAEHMYQQALAGYEKAWGPDHAKTLDTVNNLGLLYADLGRPEQAEHMYQRALTGYAKAIHPDNLLTFIPALNNMWAFASLRESQGHIEDARQWYSQALLGYEKTFGQDHENCQALRNNLDALTIEEEEEEEQ